jgi:hypothetical protein
MTTSWSTEDRSGRAALFRQPVTDTTPRTMRVMRSSRRHPFRAGWRHLRFAVLVLAVLVPAHDLVFLAAFGGHVHAHALEATGHGAYWLAIWIAMLLAVVATAVVVLHRSQRLRRELGRLGGIHVSAPRPARLAAAIARLWVALFATAIVAFVIQENLEHYGLHAHLPGLDVLFVGEYQWTIPVFAALALAAAIAGSLSVERLAALVRAVRTAARPARPARRTPRPPRRAERPARARRAIPDLGRAPPLPLS